MRNALRVPIYAKGPTIRGAVAVGDWGGSVSTQNKPLYEFVQGDFFMLLFQPECNFTPR